MSFKYGFLSLNLAYFTLNISFTSYYCSPRPTSNFSGPNLSPPQRSLSVAEMAGEKKKSKPAGLDGKRKERNRGLCHITCGSLAGLAVLWFWLNQATTYLDDSEGCLKDNSIKG